MNGEVKTYHFKSAFVNGAWADNVRMDVDGAGFITGVERGMAAASADVCFSGHAIPAMANAHSHAFQRAFAGMAEGSCDDNADSFWSWRKEMYGFLAKITPDDVCSIASQLYVEMLKSGYASVAEFHYVHNDIDGKPYADKAIMSKAIIEAANASGIGLTITPILYQQSGFDGGELQGGQKRFYLSNDGYSDIYSSLPYDSKAIGFHSLRAVSSSNMQAILDAHSNAKAIHIHIAEQVGEVEQCIAHHGARPIEYLYDKFLVDDKWCLVHATHADDGEVAAMAASRAVVALCPSTEANLGDGYFPLINYIKLGGRWAIGSDSHVTINPAEELRLLEYSMRLQNQSRIVLGDGNSMWSDAIDAGGQALGIKQGLCVGARADVIVLNPDHPNLIGRSDKQILDTLVLTSNGGGTPMISDVISGGKWVVKQSKHIDEEKIITNYKKTILSLME